MPNVLAAGGSVVAVSTKADVLAETHRARGHLGECLLYDPSGSVVAPPGVRAAGWSPLVAARSWGGAVLVAEAMVGASREGRQRADGSHWTERASTLLSAIFHAAALDDVSVPDVVSAVNRREPERFSRALARADASIALDLLEGILATEAREQSAIWSTASGVLSGFRTSAALASTEGSRLDPDRFVRSRATLYIAAPAEHQSHLAPLVAGILRDVRTAAYRRFAGNPTRRDAPILLVLDEMANIAPLHDLPVLIAEGASQGIVTLASLQDLSQARARFGVAAEGFLTLFGTKVVLAGVSDVRTLEALSTLSGRVETPIESRTSTRQPGRFRRHVSRTTTTRSEPRLAVDAIARPPSDTAIVYVGAYAGRVTLTAHFNSSPWREATGRIFRAHSPFERSAISRQEAGRERSSSR